jgi:UDP-glucuronate decarboxylase
VACGGAGRGWACALCVCVCVVCVCVHVCMCVCVQFRVLVCCARTRASAGSLLLRRRSCYDEGKRAAEALIFDYYRVYKLPVRVIRIFNTYGPRMHPFDGRVVSNFVRQALRGEPITIYGDGKQSRSFQYVDDLLEGMLRMMNNTSGFIGPVNIGNPVEFTVSELADLVIEKTGADKSLVKYLPRPTDDPTQRKPDISLAREKLEGWAPKVPLAEGLDRLIEWMRTVDFDNVRVPALWEAGLATIAKK